LRSRTLGPGAPAVSAVGFGGMHLSIQGRPPQDQALRVLHASLDAGITFIDTADVYCLDDGDIGHNERLIAEALRTWRGPRERVLVGTKGGMLRPGGRWEGDGRPEHLRRACERSLAALGVERIDLYQLHAPDPAVPIAESVGALDALRREGKIRWVGLSNVTVGQIREAERVVPITTVQNRLSPFFREALMDGVLEYCSRQGIGFLAYSPTGGGRLNLTLPQHPVLQALSARLGASPHAIVIAWLLALGPNIIAIPSARTVEHAQDSATAAELDLSEADVQEINRAAFSRA
jgi:aryl-alcohol dehydrogenase-like predicted oxidoreductase